jgi:hypothetical protein
MSDALGFELPMALAEPAADTNPLPFEASQEEEQTPVAVGAGDDDTVH